MSKQAPWAKVKAWAGLCSFLEALGQNPIPCPLPAFRSPCTPWPMAPSSILRVSRVRLSLSQAAVSLVPSSLPAFFTHEDLVIALAHADNPSPHLQVS